MIGQGGAWLMNDEVAANDPTNFINSVMRDTVRASSAMLEGYLPLLLVVLLLLVLVPASFRHHSGCEWVFVHHRTALTNKCPPVVEQTVYQLLNDTNTGVSLDLKPILFFRLTFGVTPFCYELDADSRLCD
ncbi:hypothetical protein CBL_01444 [Carabus blaptoides fortunei]